MHRFNTETKQTWYSEVCQEKVVGKSKRRYKSLGTSIPDSSNLVLKPGRASSNQGLKNAPPIALSLPVLPDDVPIGSCTSDTPITPILERGYNVSGSVFSRGRFNSSPLTERNSCSVDDSPWYPSSPTYSTRTNPRSVISSLFSRKGATSEQRRGLFSAHSRTFAPSKQRTTLNSAPPHSTHRSKILSAPHTSPADRTIHSKYSQCGSLRVERPRSIKPSVVGAISPKQDERERSTSNSQVNSEELWTIKSHSTEDVTERASTLRSHSIEKQSKCEEQREMEPTNEDLSDWKGDSREAPSLNIECQSKVVKDKEHLKSAVSNYGAVEAPSNGIVREDSSRIKLLKTQGCGAAEFFVDACSQTKRKCLSCLSKTFFCPKKHIPFVVFLIVLFLSSTVFVCWPKLMNADILDREWGFISFSENYYPAVKGTQSIKVKNSNWVPVKARSVNLELYYKDVQRVGYVSLNEAVVFKSRSSKVIDLEIYIDNGLSMDVVNKMMEDCIVNSGSGTILMSINGTIEGDFWHIPFSYAYPYSEDEVGCTGY